MQNIFSKKSVWVVTVCALLVVSVAVVFFTQKAVSDDKPFYLMSDANRREAAMQRYSTFSSDPTAETEVLISFDDVTSSDVLAILPSNVEVIACFHYYDSGSGVVGGGYFGCEGKTVEQVLSDYYQSIYDMTYNAVVRASSRVAALDRKISNLQSVGADVSGLVEQFNSEIQQIQIDQAQLEEMEQGNFMISGIRIKAANSALNSLTGLSSVYSIEIIDGGLEEMAVGMVQPVILCD